MARANFQDLRIYQLSEHLADKCWTIAIEWNNFARDTIGKQLTRCADSIGANIAEGNGRETYCDHKRFAYIARGSLFEVKHWLRRAYKRKLLSEEDIHNLQAIIDELLPKMNAYINSLIDQQNRD